MQKKWVFELAQFAQNGWITCDRKDMEGLEGDILKAHPQARSLVVQNQAYLFLPSKTEHLLHGLKFSLEHVREETARLEALIEQLCSFPLVSPFGDVCGQDICQYDVFCKMDVKRQSIRVFTTHHVQVSEDSPRIWVAHELGTDFNLPETVEAWDQAASENGVRLYVLWESGDPCYRLGNIQTDWQGVCEFTQRYLQVEGDFVQLRGLCVSFFPKGSLARTLQKSRESNF